MRRLALLLLLLLAAACDRAAPPAPRRGASTAATPQAVLPTAPITDRGVVDRSQAGLAATDAWFLDGEGSSVNLEALRGRPVLLNLWATWCAPCVAEMPTLDALAAREAGALSVVTVSEDGEGEGQSARQKVDAFFTAKKFARLGAYLDPDSALMTQLGVSVLPTTILYDAAGKEVWRVTGELDWTGPRARALIAEAQ